jgi:hypothetical protein
MQTVIQNWEYKERFVEKLRNKQKLKKKNTEVIHKQKDRKKKTNTV